MNKAEQIYLEQFKEWFFIKGHTNSTVNSTSKTVTYFLEWITEQAIESEQVSYNDVLAYINYKKKKGNKQRTLQLITNGVNHFYHFLQSEHHVKENPVSNVKVIGIKRKVWHEILTPEELETLYKSFPTEIKIAAGCTCPPQGNNELARKRNKMILGLIIYQGLRTEEIGKLELQDLQLREGKIKIHKAKRTEGRTLKLEAHQVYDLMDYVNVIRKQ